MWIAGLAGGRRRSEQPPSKDLFHHFFNQVQLDSDFVPKLRGVFNPTFLVKLPFFGNMTGKLCHQLLGMPRNGREREFPLTPRHSYFISTSFQLEMPHCHRSPMSSSPPSPPASPPPPPSPPSAPSHTTTLEALTECDQCHRCKAPPQISRHCGTNW